MNPSNSHPFQEQEWNLSSLIQAQEEQRSLECYEINIDPIVRHKLAKYVRHLLHN